MQQWTMHKFMLRNPPTDRMRDVRLLHCTQSVPLLGEHSSLLRNMPQRKDEEVGKCLVLSAACLRGNGVIHRTQKVIQGDDNGHVGRPGEVSLAPPYLELFASYGASAVTRTSD